MADIEPHLQQRASALRPTAGQFDAAARSQNRLRDLLDSGNMLGRIRNSYLSGSYARHTAIRPLDDVDIVFEIDPSMWKTSFWKSGFSQLPTPEDTIATFTRAIRLRYPNSTVCTQRRSAGLKMEHLDIDVVPAVVHEENAGWIYVPDRVTGTWIVSAPVLHAMVSTEVNDACQQKFKPVVRLLKGWNGSLPSTASFKSFAVESIAAHVLANRPQPTIFMCMLVVLDFIAARGGYGTIFESRDSYGISLGGMFGSVLPDVGGTGSNILAGVDNTRAGKFTAAARVMRDQLVKASMARTSDVAWGYVDNRTLAGFTRL